MTVLQYIYFIMSKSSYLDDYRIIKTLGSGYHAKVKLAEAPNQQLVAIKRFKKETANLGTLKHELSIMAKLHHDNLVNLIEVKESATYKKKTGQVYQCFAIVLQYVGGGELFDFIALGGKFAPNVARTYFHQLMNGLHYMHQNGVAHRDIKPENILLTSNFILKLADFGFSAFLEGKDKSGILHTKLGTQGYMAPEIQTRNYVGTQVDIFAAGVILFIMYSGSPPFERAVPNDTYYKLIKDKNYTSFWNAHSKRRPTGFYPEDFRDLLNGMFAYNPEERLKIDQVANHPWTKGPVQTTADLSLQFQTRKKKIEIDQEKQRLEKQAKKNQRNDAIFTNNKFRAEEDKELSVFLQNYETIENNSTQLPLLKRKIKKDDYVIKEQEAWFFASLFSLLQSPITFTEEEEGVIDSIEFTSKYVQKGPQVNINFSYNIEDQQEQLEANLYVSKTSNDNLVINFEHISGSTFYFRKLVNALQSEFAYCQVNE